jgi:glycosyltransferase involved in cell wall biosynthesis
MKIALVNYRYFISGGPERYMFNIKEILEVYGHEIIPFSVKHKKNTSTEYEKYFLDPIGIGDEIYAGEYNVKSIKNISKVISRMLYSFEAKRKFKYFLKEVKPDIVYILYFQNKISCSIIDAAYSMNIPVVQRISDYSLLCPCNIFYRYDINQICELCLYRNKLNAVKYKCVYNSYLYSFIKVLAIDIQKFVKVKHKIDKFIFPSEFTLSKFIEAGYPKNKLCFLPTLFNLNLLKKELSIEYNHFALYIGRTDPDKGLMTLLDAFIDTDHPLKIIGFSNGDYYNQLIEYTKGKRHNIEFLGRMDFDDMQNILSKCLFTIIPSEWYDNLPNALLESYAFKKCVIATDIGSLTENVINNETGLLFTYKDSKSLREKMSYLFNNPDKAIEFGENARKTIDTTYCINIHVSKLLEVFQEMIKD